MMSPSLFNVYMDALMKEVKVEMGKMELGFMEEGKDGRLPGLLYANNLVLRDDTEGKIKMIVGRYVFVFRRRGLKVNADKNKVIVSGGEEGFGCYIRVVQPMEGESEEELETEVQQVKPKERR